MIAAPTVTDARFGRAFSGAYWQIVTAEGHGPEFSDGPFSLALGPCARSSGCPREEQAALAHAARARSVNYNSVGPLPPPPPPPSSRPLRVAAMQARLDGVAAPVDHHGEQRIARPSTATCAPSTPPPAIALVLLGAGLIAAVVIQVRVGLQPLFALRREVAAVRTGERSERIEGPLSQ